MAHHPAWKSLPTFIWAIALVIGLFVFRRELKIVFQMLNRRLRMGASFKLGSFEVGQAYVDPGQGTVSGGFVRVARKDADAKRHKEREQYYQPNRLLMRVHRISPSEQPGPV